MVDKAVTIQQNILGKTNGLCQKHEIIKEGQEGDGPLPHAHPSACFLQQIQTIERHGSACGAGGRKPRVAIFADETIEGSDSQDHRHLDGIAQGASGTRV